MVRSRVAALVFGSALAVGGFAATALAESSPSSSSTPSSTSATSTPATQQEAATHVNTNGGPVTLTVAGVGTVTLTVDPTTAAISNVVVTPIDGVSTGAPMTTPEGVEIQVTAADGTTQVLEIKARHEDAGLEVEAELEVEDHEAADDNGHDGQNANAPDDRRGPNRGPENGNDQNDNRGTGNDDRGHDDGAPSATTTQGVFSPGTGSSGDDGRHAGDQSGGEQSGSSGRSGGGHSDSND